MTLSLITFSILMLSLLVLEMILYTFSLFFTTKLFKLNRSIKVSFYTSIYFAFIPILAYMLSNLLSNSIASIFIYIVMITALVLITKRVYKASYLKSIGIYLCVSIIVLIILFLVIKFVFFPAISYLSATSMPLVVIQSASMSHTEKGFEKIFRTDTNYLDNSISLNDTFYWSFQGGLNRGDIVLIKPADNVQIGDVILFKVNNGGMIISRVISENPIKTKGDNNPGLLYFENSISKDNIIGKADSRIPYLGWLFKQL